MSGTIPYLPTISEFKFVPSLPAFLPPGVLGGEVSKGELFTMILIYASSRGTSTVPPGTACARLGQVGIILGGGGVVVFTRSVWEGGM